MTSIPRSIPPRRQHNPSSNPHDLPQITLPTKDVTEHRETDVLCGRGGAALRHPGNQTYRHLVNMNKGLYTTCLKAEKLKISRSIVAAIREQNGRFLERDPNKGTWFDIGDKKAIEKTSQALREGQPKLRQKIVELGRKQVAAIKGQHGAGAGGAGGAENLSASAPPSTMAGSAAAADPGQQQQQVLHGSLTSAAPSLHSSLTSISSASPHASLTGSMGSAAGEAAAQAASSHTMHVPSLQARQQPTVPTMPPRQKGLPQSLQDSLGDFSQLVPPITSSNTSGGGGYQRSQFEDSVTSIGSEATQVRGNLAYLNDSNMPDVAAQQAAVEAAAAGVVPITRLQTVVSGQAATHPSQQWQQQQTQQIEEGKDSIEPVSLRSLTIDDDEAEAKRQDKELQPGEQQGEGSKRHRKERRPSIRTQIYLQQPTNNDFPHIHDVGMNVGIDDNIATSQQSLMSDFSSFRGSFVGSVRSLMTDGSTLKGGSTAEVSIWDAAAQTPTHENVVNAGTAAVFIDRLPHQMEDGTTPLPPETGAGDTPTVTNAAKRAAVSSMIAERRSLFASMKTARRKATSNKADGSSGKGMSAGSYTTTNSGGVPQLPASGMIDSSPSIMSNFSSVRSGIRRDSNKSNASTLNTSARTGMTGISAMIDSGRSLHSQTFTSTFGVDVGSDNLLHTALAEGGVEEGGSMDGIQTFESKRSLLSGLSVLSGGGPNGGFGSKRSMMSGMSGTGESIYSELSRNMVGSVSTRSLMVNSTRSIAMSEFSCGIDEDGESDHYDEDDIEEDKTGDGDSVN